MFQISNSCEMNISFNDGLPGQSAKVQPMQKVNIDLFHFWRIALMAYALVNVVSNYRAQMPVKSLLSCSLIV